METFTFLASLAFIAVTCWLAFYMVTSGQGTPSPSRDPEPPARSPSLYEVGVGDAVILTGKAAGEFERIVRPISDADRHHLWVEGRKYNRSNGFLADSQWFEVELSRIEVEPEWME